MSSTLSKEVATTRLAILESSSLSTKVVKERSSPSSSSSSFGLLLDDSTKSTSSSSLDVQTKKATSAALKSLTQEDLKNQHDETNNHDHDEPPRGGGRRIKKATVLSAPSFKAPISATSDKVLSSLLSFPQQHQPLLTTSKKGMEVIGEEQPHGKRVRFIYQLYQILERQMCTNVVAWLPNGKAFAVFDRDQFEVDIMPLVLGSHAKFSSFVRRLMRWNFKQANDGTTCLFANPYFLRENPRLLKRLRSKDSSSKEMDKLQDQKKTLLEKKKKAQNKKEQATTATKTVEQNKTPLVTKKSLSKSDNDTTMMIVSSSSASSSSSSSLDQSSSSSLTSSRPSNLEEERKYLLSGFVDEEKDKEVEEDASSPRKVVDERNTMDMMDMETDADAEMMPMPPLPFPVPTRFEPQRESYKQQHELPLQLPLQGTQDDEDEDLQNVFDNVDVVPPPMNDVPPLPLPPPLPITVPPPPPTIPNLMQVFDDAEDEEEHDRTMAVNVPPPPPTVTYFQAQTPRRPHVGVVVVQEPNNSPFGRSSSEGRRMVVAANEEQDERRNYPKQNQEQHQQPNDHNVHSTPSSRQRKKDVIAARESLEFERQFALKRLLELNEMSERLDSMEEAKKKTNEPLVTPSTSSSKRKKQIITKMHGNALPASSRTYYGSDEEQEEEENHYRRPYNHHHRQWEDNEGTPYSHPISLEGGEPSSPTSVTTHGEDDDYNHKKSYRSHSRTSSMRSNKFVSRNFHDIVRNPGAHHDIVRNSGAHPLKLRLAPAPSYYDISKDYERRDLEAQETGSLCGPSRSWESEDSEDEDILLEHAHYQEENQFLFRLNKWLVG